MAAEVRQEAGPLIQGLSCSVAVQMGVTLSLWGRVEWIKSLKRCQFPLSKPYNWYFDSSAQHLPSAGVSVLWARPRGWQVGTFAHTVPRGSQWVLEC